MRFRRLSLQEIAHRRANAARDADLLQSGWTPDERTLADAPFMTDYIETTYPGTDRPALYGSCTGHPLLNDGPVYTSPITARGEGWVRTEGRFYRLGEKRLTPPARPLEELIQRLEAAQPPQSTEPLPDFPPDYDPLDGYPDFKGW